MGLSPTKKEESLAFLWWLPRPVQQFNNLPSNGHVADLFPASLHCAVESPL